MGHAQPRRLSPPISACPRSPPRPPRVPWPSFLSESQPVLNQSISTNLHVLPPRTGPPVLLSSLISLFYLIHPSTTLSPPFYGRGHPDSRNPDTVWVAQLGRGPAGCGLGLQQSRAPPLLGTQGREDPRGWAGRFPSLWPSPPGLPCQTAWCLCPQPLRGQAWPPCHWAAAGSSGMAG